MKNSAHTHRKSGHRLKGPKRESDDMNAKLICFLSARGLYQHGRHNIDFRSHKNRLDGKHAA